MAASVEMVDVIEAVRAAFVAYSRGDAVAPPRTALELPGRGTTLTMPAALPGQGTTVVKVVSVYPNNPSRGLPTILGLIAVLDADSGQPVALMEGAYLTGLRTGAASGVATDALARPDARTLGLIGAGFQARFQAEAVAAVRPIDTVWVYSRDGQRRHAFAAELQAHMAGRGCSAEVRATDSARGAVRRADVVCTATTSATPVFDGGDIPEGAHVNGVGSFRLDMREAPVELIRRARVVVDAREAARTEAGDLLPAVEAGWLDWSLLPELGEVLLGRQPGRQAAEEITFFKSVGLAVQDVAVAGLVARRARERGTGQPVPL